MSFYSLLWDVLAVVVIVVSIAVCVRQGFAKKILSVCSYIIALVLSRIITPICSTWIFEKMLEPSMRSLVGTSVDNAVQASADSVVAEFPDWIARILEEFSISEGMYSSDFSTEMRQTIISSVMESLQEPVMQILTAICFLLFFLLIAFFIRRIAGFFGLLNNLPAIGTMNRFLGGVLGAVQGVAILLVLSVVFKLIISMTGDDLVWLNQEVLSQSFIMSVFQRFLN